MATFLFQLDNADEQAAAVRREMRGRIKAADKIEMQQRYPRFYLRGKESESIVRQQYLHELRSQVRLASPVISHLTKKYHAMLLMKIFCRSLKFNPIKKVW